MKSKKKRADNPKLSALFFKVVVVPGVSGVYRLLLIFNQKLKTVSVNVHDFDIFISF